MLDIRKQRKMGEVFGIWNENKDAETVDISEKT
jgi:hypothetical protein